jgi:hypothetical protein
MSYDITTQKQNARSRADQRAQDEIYDLNRFRFIDKLDRADFKVTDWEAEFIESILRAAASQPVDRRVPRFTPNQRKSIDGMRKEYEGRM